jgi:hypothetical protein
MEARSSAREKVVQAHERDASLAVNFGSALDVGPGNDRAL